MGTHLDDKRSGFWRLAFSYLACYAIWLGLSALGVWTLLSVRDALLSMLPIFGPWVMGAVDKYAFVLFGLIFLIWALYTEDALRRSVVKGELRKRALRLAGMQLSALVVVYTFKFLVTLWI